MEWATLAALIVQYGLPLAIKIADKWESKDIVTPEELAELKKLSEQTPETQMRDALLRNGVDPNSERGAQLLALVGAKAQPVAEVKPPA